MAVHAAMIDRVDQGIGELLQVLKDTGRYDNTMIFVLSDNGASPERYISPGFDRASETRDGRPIRYTGLFVPGSETTWGYIGPYWASAANTPYRYWKAESFEGGCHTPLIVHWPAGLDAARGRTTGQVGHVIDLMPTCLELAGVPYPDRYAGHALKPLEGRAWCPFSAASRSGPSCAVLRARGRPSGPRRRLETRWRGLAVRGNCTRSRTTPRRHRTLRIVRRGVWRRWLGGGDPGRRGLAA